MALTLADFEASPVPPNPTAKEMQALAAMGSQASKSDRKAVVNTIGALIGVPNGGWSEGQSRIFQHDDARIVGLLRRLSHDKLASNVAKDVERVTKYVHVDMMLALTSAAREYHRSIGARGKNLVDSFDEGGLDYLWDNIKKLGLPASVTSKWSKPAVWYTSAETHKEVHPALIPVEDQLLAYSAQMSASYRMVQAKFDEWAKAQGVGASMTARAAALVWKSYAFLAPGTRDVYDTKATFDSQLGRGFNAYKAMSYAAQAPRSPALGTNYLNLILVDPQLNRVENVRIAKARVLEALYLEHLLREARAALPP